MGVWFSLNGDEALEWLLQWLCFACALFLFSNDLYVVNFSRLKLFISSCRRHDRYWALWPQVMYGMQFCMSLVGLTVSGGNSCPREYCIYGVSLFSKYKNWEKLFVGYEGSFIPTCRICFETVSTFQCGCSVRYSDY